MIWEVHQSHDEFPNINKSQGNHTLFIKHSNSSGVIILLVYVDDIIVIGINKHKQQRLSQCLVREFEIKTFGKIEIFSRN